jgi:hypothetical protein
MRSKPATVVTANGFEIIPTEEILWSLTQLPKECTSWIVPPETFELA